MIRHLDRHARGHGRYKKEDMDAASGVQRNIIVQVSPAEMKQYPSGTCLTWSDKGA
jgi:hypothetical protein